MVSLFFDYSGMLRTVSIYLRFKLQCQAMCTCFIWYICFFHLFTESMYIYIYTSYARISPVRFEKSQAVTICLSMGPQIFSSFFPALKAGGVQYSIYVKRWANIFHFRLVDIYLQKFSSLVTMMFDVGGLLCKESSMKADGSVSNLEW